MKCRDNKAKRVQSFVAAGPLVPKLRLGNLNPEALLREHTII